MRNYDKFSNEKRIKYVLRKHKLGLVPLAVTTLFMVNTVTAFAATPATEVASQDAAVLVSALVSNDTSDVLGDAEKIFNSDTPLAEELENVFEVPAPAPAPAPVNPDVIVVPSETEEPTATTEETPSFKGNVTFITRNGDQTVQFNNGDEHLDKTDENGNSASVGDAGGGFTKAYFIGFSNIKNYLGKPGEKMVYKEEPIKNLFPDGIKDDTKVYAIYLDSSAALALSKQLSGKIDINKELESDDYFYHKKIVADGVLEDGTDKKIHNLYVGDSIADKSRISESLSETAPVNWNASFHLNPFITAIVRYSPEHYFQPGTAEFYPTTDEAKLNDPKNKEYTYVDLHVKLDERLILNNELDFMFKSYSFKPHMLLNKNGDKLIAQFTVEKNNPSTRILLDTKNIVGNEFVLRTRIRSRTDIPDVSLETASEDMRLISNSENNFRVLKLDIIKIANKESNPLLIQGHIDGFAQLYGTKLFGIIPIGGPQDIPKTSAKPVELNFKFNKITFDTNLASIGEQADSTLEEISVIHKSSVEGDFLSNNVPDFITIKADMPKAPTSKVVNGVTYHFKEWNTKADGTGMTFDGQTEVTQDMQVFAIWTKSYPVSYRFESVTPSKQLPQEVLDLLPKDSAEYESGSVVLARKPQKGLVTTTEGTWRFSGYDEKSKTVETGPIVFKGYWLLLSEPPMIDQGDKHVEIPNNPPMIDQGDKHVEIPNNPPMEDPKPDYHFEIPDNPPMEEPKPDYHFEIPNNPPMEEPKPDYHFEIPNNPPMEEPKPDYHFEIPDNPPMEEPKPDYHFEIPNNPPMEEPKPDYHFEIPNNPPMEEPKPDYHFEIPNNPPMINWQEMDIPEEMAQGSTQKHDSNKAGDKQLPKTNDTSSLVASLIGIVDLLTLGLVVKSRQRDE